MMNSCLYCVVLTLCYLLNNCSYFLPFPHTIILINYSYVSNLSKPSFVKPRHFLSLQQTILNESSLYNSPDAEGNTLLLILDRRDDPVTPLLHQASHPHSSPHPTLKNMLYILHTLYIVHPCFTH